jgi:hypothetical protein
MRENLEAQAQAEAARGGRYWRLKLISAGKNQPLGAEKAA